MLMGKTKVLSREIFVGVKTPYSHSSLLTLFMGFLPSENEGSRTEAADARTADAGRTERDILNHCAQCRMPQEPCQPPLFAWPKSYARSMNSSSSAMALISGSNAPNSGSSALKHRGAATRGGWVGWVGVGFVLVRVGWVRVGWVRVGCFRVD